MARYFGFVIGGALPVAVAADWLTSAWDQNGGGYTPAPALSVVEEVAAGWVRELLGLPATAASGSSPAARWRTSPAWPRPATRCCATRAGTSRPTASRGRPEVRVIAGEQAHVTVTVACRMLGLGVTGRAWSRPTTRAACGRRARAELDRDDGPTIVCAQAGEINTGAFDPIAEIVDACRAARRLVPRRRRLRAWAAASPGRRHLLAGLRAGGLVGDRRATSG